MTVLPGTDVGKRSDEVGRMGNLHRMPGRFTHGDCNGMRSRPRVRVFCLPISDGDPTLVRSPWCLMGPFSRLVDNFLVFCENPKHL